MFHSSILTSTGEDELTCFLSIHCKFGATTVLLQGKGKFSNYPKLSGSSSNGSTWICIISRGDTEPNSPGNRIGICGALAPPPASPLPTHPQHHPPILPHPGTAPSYLLPNPRLPCGQCVCYPLVPEQGTLVINRILPSV